eukprot:4053890-Amphidinium_carterae.1
MALHLCNLIGQELLPMSLLDELEGSHHLRILQALSRYISPLSPHSSILAHLELTTPQRRQRCVPTNDWTIALAAARPVECGTAQAQLRSADPSTAPQGMEEADEIGDFLPWIMVNNYTFNMSKKDGMNRSTNTEGLRTGALQCSAYGLHLLLSRF